MCARACLYVNEYGMATHLISRGIRLQGVFSSQHGWWDHDARKDYIAKVTVVAQPMAEHTDPGSSHNMKRKKQFTKQIWSVNMSYLTLQFAKLSKYCNPKTVY
jgi:hypothetical protein